MSIAEIPEIMEQKLKIVHDASELQNALNTPSKNLGWNGNPQYDYGSGSFPSLLTQLQYGAIRNADPLDVILKLQPVLREISTLEHENLLVRFLIYLRDCRGGKGERKVFNVIIRELFSYGFKNLVSKLFDILPEFGREKDLFDLVLYTINCKQFRKSTDKEIVEFVLDRIADKYNINNLKDEPDILFLKWLPREGKDKSGWRKSFKDFYGKSFHTVLVKKIWPEKLIGLTKEEQENMLKTLKKEYRKKIVEADTIEMRICEQKEESITLKEIGEIPSGAWNKHLSVFSNKRELPRRELLKSNVVTHLLEGGKVKGGQADLTLFISKIITGNVTDFDKLVMNAQADSLIEELLKKCQQYADNYDLNGISAESMVGLIDVSGSMETHNEILYAILVGYLVARLGPLKGVITFESQPKWVDLSDVLPNFVDTVKKIRSIGWGGSTDFISALRLLISKAEENNLSPESFPKYLVIPSDMQIDSADRSGGSSRKTMQERIDDLFRDSKFSRPIIVYWNLSPDTDGSPAQTSTEGIVLYSGQSPAIFQQILSGHMAEEIPVEEIPVEEILEDTEDEEDETEVVKVHSTKQQTRQKTAEENLYDALLNSKYDIAAEACLNALKVDKDANVSFTDFVLAS